MTSNTKLLLVASDPALRKALARECQRHCGEVDAVANPEEASGRLKEGSCDIIVCDPGEAFDLGWLDNPELIKIPTVLITRQAIQNHLDSLMARPHLRNFVGFNETFSQRDLSSTVAKLVGREKRPGLESFLVDGSKLHSTGILDSREKENYINKALHELDVKKLMTDRMANKIGVILDELIMNILWDAPLDAEGRHLFKHLARTEHVQLTPEQAGCITVGFDGRYIGLAARDPFGGLKYETVLKYFKKCFFSEQQIGSEGGGAGLGLFLAYNFCVQFSMNVQPGKMTEFVLLFDPSMKESAVQRCAKSFHFFEC